MAGTEISDATLTSPVFSTDMIPFGRPASAVARYMTLSALSIWQTQFGIGVNGIDINPGSDINADMVTVNVTGYPKISWNEASHRFLFNAGINLDDGAGDSPLVVFVGGSNDDAASLWLSDNAVAGQSDFVIRLPGDTVASQLKILNASSVLQHFFGADGEVVFNEVGNDADFRVEGVGQTHLIFGDAANVNVSINSTSVSAHYDLLLGGDGTLCLKESATPTATAAYGKLYCKDSNELFFQDGAGVEHKLAYA